MHGASTRSRNATFTTINGRAAVTSRSGDSATAAIVADGHAVVGINGEKIPFDTLTGIDAHLRWAATVRADQGMISCDTTSLEAGQR